MKDRFGDILDQMQAGVYMTDVQTHEILFMNRKMKEDYGLENPEGKICWQVLQEGQTGPCGFCKIPTLSGERERIVCWRDHSAVAGKVFDRYDSLVPWQGGLVHMQQAYDVTNLLQLSEYATKDALCAVFNRSRGKAMLSERLAGLAGAHTCLIALLDVDNLKAVNDRYGHAEGDFLLRQTCAVLKGHLQGQDYLFRLSGDEFVLVMMDMPEKEAARLMRAWRREVEQLRALHGKPYDFSFSFGVSSCGAKGVCRASELIARADERMYEEKLRRRKTVLLDRDENVFRTDKTAGRTMNYPTGMLYEALERSTDDYVYLCDMKTGVFRYSPAQVRQFDLPGEFVENPLPCWKRIVHPDDWERFYKSNMEIGENKRDSHSVEFRARNRGGEYVWLRCRGQLMRDEYGEPCLFAGIMTQLGRQNKIDPLTQLLNHSEFLAAVQRGVQEESIEQLGILVLDVDGFRNINEMYGRAFGDRVLRTLAQSVQALLPDNASLYRLDNDRLGILMDNDSRTGAARLFRRVQERLVLMQEWKQSKLAVEVSAGYAEYPGDGAAADELYQYADYALQYAKSHGRNRLEIFSDEILRGKVRALELMRRLREAISQSYRGFRLAYQPQVDGSTGEIVGVEALMRWQDVTGENVSPVEFIPILEEQGMIYGAGLWALRTALRAARGWVALKSDFTVSVNISALQMMEKRFLRDLTEIVRTEDFPCENLILELTESCTVQNLNIFESAFKQMRAMGIRVAMDDFGTGYSSLEILKRTPVDIVKIDRGFVKGILNSRFDATFISFVVAICHEANIRVCLEGVEEAAEVEFLKDMHLDCIQGYYFGRPLEAGEITARLEGVGTR